MSKLNIVHLLRDDFGGAGRAGISFHKTCLDFGHNSVCVVQNKQENLDTIIKYEKPYIPEPKPSIKVKIKNKLRSILAKNNRSIEPFDVQIVDKQKEVYCFYNTKEINIDGIAPKIENYFESIDILFVHWISGFVNTSDILRIQEKTNCRVIFTMMDMAPITGGCHYTWDCKGFETNCLNCPALTHYEKYLASDQLLIKAKNMARMKAELSSGAEHDIVAAQKSVIPFYRFWKIRIPINTTIFRPKLNEPNKNEINLLGSATVGSSFRKGYDYLEIILILLDRWYTGDKIINFYYPKTAKKINWLFNNINIVEFDFINSEEKLADLYNSIDIFLSTSIEDSGPLMLLESLLCGTEAIAFDEGMAAEILIEKSIGDVIPVYKCEDFSKSLINRIEKFEYNFQKKNMNSNLIKNRLGFDKTKIEFIKMLTGPKK